VRAPNRGPAPARTGPHENAATDPLGQHSNGSFGTSPIARARDRAADRRAPGPRLSGPGTLRHLPLPWAERLIASVDGPVPKYGSPAWTALPSNSPVRVAACVRAAEFWRTRDRAAEVFAFSGGRRAREIAEARRPRPGDHPGGPVPWWGGDEVGS
jgi:hypothetical protein